MSTFDDDWEAVVGDLYDRFADTVTYNPPTGAPVILSAILSARTEDIIRDDRGQKIHRRLEIRIPRTATAAAGGNGNYVADPSHRATVTWNSVNYAVEDAEGAIVLTLSEATLRLVLTAHKTKSRPKHRGTDR